ncbi:MAG: hypothetical protein ACYC54_15020 [Sedimentisphaerales bacterium]
MKTKNSTFRVTYSIDVEAKSELDAAKQVYQIMQDPNSFLPVLDVKNSKGKTTRIDLAK